MCFQSHAAQALLIGQSQTAESTASSRGLSTCRARSPVRMRMCTTPPAVEHLFRLIHSPGREMTISRQPSLPITRPPLPPCPPTSSSTHTPCSLQPYLNEHPRDGDEIIHFWHLSAKSSIGSKNLKVSRGEECHVPQRNAEQGHFVPLHPFILH